MNSWNPAQIMERLMALEAKIKNSDVIANPTGEATDTLEKVSIDGDIYSIEGTTVEANPEGAATAELSKLEVGETIYSIPKEPDYSTSEVDTGVKWIDGKEIYRKVISIASLPNATTETYSYDIEGTFEIIKFEAFAKYSSGTVAILPRISVTQLGGNMVVTDGTIDIQATTSALQIVTFVDRSAVSASVIVYYTKTPAEAKKSSKKK